MEISIIIPVFNVEKYIDQCLESVLNQSLKDFELIIVDDGSTDGSGKIIDKYQKRDSRIQVIHKKNEGVSIARNIALERCNGEYIYIMDSDDYLESDALEIMLGTALTTNADVVISDHCKFTEKNKQRICYFFPESFVTDDRKTILQLQKMVLHKGYSPFPTKESFGIGIGAPWTKLVRRNFILQNGLQFDPYVRGVFDDCLFSLSIFEHAKKVAYCHAITYHFRIMQTSLTHKFRPNQLEIYSRIYERIIQFGNQYNKGEDFQEAYYARVMLYLRQSFNTYFFHKDYQGSPKKNYKEFVSTIKSRTYSEAIFKADTNRLSKREKMIVLFEKAHMINILWMLCTIIKYLYKLNKLFRSKIF